MVGPSAGWCTESLHFLLPSYLCGSSPVLQCIAHNCPSILVQHMSHCHVCLCSCESVCVQVLVSVALCVALLAKPVYALRSYLVIKDQKDQCLQLPARGCANGSPKPNIPPLIELLPSLQNSFVKSSTGVVVLLRPCLVPHMRATLGCPARRALGRWTALMVCDQHVLEFLAERRCTASFSHTEFKNVRLSHCKLADIAAVAITSQT